MLPPFNPISNIEFWVVLLWRCCDAADAAVAHNNKSKTSSSSLSSSVNTMKSSFGSKRCCKIQSMIIGKVQVDFEVQIRKDFIERPFLKI